MKFESLNSWQQEQAKAMFFDARSGDGYFYELLPDGRILCRSKT